MYAVIAIALVAAFAFVTVVVPTRWSSLYGLLQVGLRRTVLCTANQALFQPDEETARRTLFCVKMWFFVAAAVFVGLGIYDGTVIRNEIDSVTTVAFYGLLAFLASSFIVLSFVAYSWLLPGFRAFATLSRCGFRGVWVLSKNQLPNRLSAQMIEKASATKRISVVDVSGYELLVKGPANSEGLLIPLLNKATDLPVSLLLLNPLSSEMDPDRRQMTVYQSVLAEMEMQAATYMKRLHKTVATIAAINAERSPEAQIEIRYYNEKPTMRAVMFDDTMFVLPWRALLQNGDVPCLEVTSDATVPSFYETFRRDCSRLWRTSVVQVFTS